MVSLGRSHAHAEQMEKKGRQRLKTWGILRIWLYGLNEVTHDLIMNARDSKVFRLKVFFSPQRLYRAVYCQFEKKIPNVDIDDVTLEMEWVKLIVMSVQGLDNRDRESWFPCAGPSSLDGSRQLAGVGMRFLSLWWKEANHRDIQIFKGYQVSHFKYQGYRCHQPE